MLGRARGEGGPSDDANFRGCFGQWKLRVRLAHLPNLPCRPSVADHPPLPTRRSAMGANPVRTVEWMGKIIAEAETHISDVTPSF